MINIVLTRFNKNKPQAILLRMKAILNLYINYNIFYFINFKISSLKIKTN